MQAICGRAVAACALPGEAEALRGMLERAGFSDVICVGDGLSAVRQAQSAQTDLIVADAVLPVLDGGAMCERLWSSALTVYPAVVLLSSGGISSKNADAALEKPVREAELSAVLASIEIQKRRIPEDKRSLALAALRHLGVPEHCGRDYLLGAIEMAWLDARLLRQLTGRLYPAVALRFGEDKRHVERAMRHVIDEAWRSGAVEAQYKLFGETIDARRGSPTLGEMIARIADILRWEGKA